MDRFIPNRAARNPELDRTPLIGSPALTYILLRAHVDDRLLRFRPAKPLQPPPLLRRKFAPSIRGWSTILDAPGLLRGYLPLVDWGPVLAVGLHTTLYIGVQSCERAFYPQRIQSVMWQPRGEQLLITLDKSVHLVTEEGKTIRMEDGNLTTWRNDQQFTLGREKTISHMDLRTSKLTGLLTIEGRLDRLGWTGNYLVCSAEEGLTIFDRRSSRILEEFETPRSFKTFAFSPRFPHTMVVSNETNSLHYFSVSLGRRTKTKEATLPVSQVQWPRRLLLTHANQISAVNEDLAPVETFVSPSPLLHSAMSFDQQHLCALSKDESLLLWDRSQRSR